MTSQRVLLTGAFGALGRHTLLALTRLGHRVRTFDLDRPANRRLARRAPPGTEVHWGDLRDAASVRNAVRGVDAIVHMAFVIHPDSEAAPELARAVNVGGTEALLEAAQAEPQPPRFVFASSYHVHPYVAARPTPIAVDDPVAATDHYAAHKIACEKAIRASRLRWSILRLSSIMLDRQPDEKNMRIVFGVPLDTRMEMVHPDDAALAYARAITTPACEGKTLFIGGGPSCQTTYRELLRDSFAARGLPMLPESAFAESPPFIGDWLDTRESQALLDYQRTSLRAWIESSQKLPGPARWGAAIAAPLVHRWMLRYSPYWGRR